MSPNDDIELIRKQFARVQSLQPLDVQMQPKVALKTASPKEKKGEPNTEAIDKVKASLKAGYKALTEEIDKLAKEGVLFLDGLEEPIAISSLEITDSILEQLADTSRGDDERIDLVGCSEQGLLCYYLLAKKLHEDKMLDEAVDAMCLLTHIGPQISPFWLSLGVAYSDRKEWEEASKALQKAIEVNPSDFTPFRVMITIATETHDFAHLKELLETYKETPEIKDEVEIALELLPQIMKGGL